MINVGSFPYRLQHIYIYIAANTRSMPRIVHNSVSAPSSSTKTQNFRLHLLGRSQRSRLVTDLSVTTRRDTHDKKASGGFHISSN